MKSKDTRHYRNQDKLSPPKTQINEILDVQIMTKKNFQVLQRVTKSPALFRLGGWLRWDSIIRVESITYFNLLCLPITRPCSYVAFKMSNHFSRLDKGYCNEVNALWNPKINIQPILKNIYRKKWWWNQMNIFNFAEKGAVEMGDAALTG